MKTGFKAGERCIVVSGDVANIGTHVTLLEYSEEAGGWLFDEAWPPLLIDGEEYRHSLEAPDGVLVVVAEDGPSSFRVESNADNLSRDRAG